tara:strand:+ start:2210 stop:2572 length:363 start_codon:yes stop_codon:yes gene_type:complete
MNTNKHTPAPWEHLAIPHNRATSVQYEIVSDDSMSIAYTTHHVYEADMNEANARLIAAAPDLLDALSALVAVMHATYDKLDEYVAAGDDMLRNPLANKKVQSVADMATDALNKAIGENQE